MTRCSTLRTLFWLILPLLAASLYLGATPARAELETSWPAVQVVERWSGVAKPLGVTNAGDGSGRLFVTEQQGRVRVIKSGQLLAEPFLDLRQQVLCCAERGLLGLAFPPGFSQKQYFYVFYSDLTGASVLARFWVSDENPDRADPSSEQIVLSVAQPGQHHKAGHLAFGPDGYLYVALGDGAFSNLTNINMSAQDPASLLGKILRIDPESTVTPPQRWGQHQMLLRSATYHIFLPVLASQGHSRYRIPPSNPFVGQPGYLGEIWALGLRNPWRFSFDRQTGDLIMGDVGQNRYEEIDFQQAGDPGGQNYGWPIMAGTHCYLSPTCDSQGLTLPVIEYDHTPNGRCAVIGGYVYRGQAFAALRGIYLFGDYCTGEIWGMQRVDGVWQSALLGDAPFVLTSFGEDEAGNLYVTDYSSNTVHQIVPAVGQGERRRAIGDYR